MRWGPVAVALATLPCAVAGQASDPLSRPARLSVSDVPLEEALLALQRASGVSVVFSADVLPGGRVTCQCVDRDVDGALGVLLEGTGLVREVRGGRVLVLAPVRSGELARGVLTGTVRDGETGEPIPNASVSALGAGATLSDGSGRYRLTVPAPAEVALRVEALGWVDWIGRTRRVEPGAIVHVDVPLEPAAIPLGEILVVPGAFGVLDERLTYAPATLTREQIETVPQLGEDVFRVLQRLPGVTSDDVSTRLQVRGGSDRELLVTLDGYELYEPYHLKDFDGALGIVDVNVLGGIELLTGGFPVKYGDRLTGVFDMTTRAAPEEGARTAVGLSITNATVASRGRFAGGRGDWLFSARRGYLDLALALARSEDRFSPTYYDVLGRAEYRLGDRHALSVHGLFASDALTIDEVDADIASRWGSAYGWLTWKAFWTSAVTSRTTLGVGRVDRDRTLAGRDDEVLIGLREAEVTDRRTLDVASLRQEWSIDVAPTLNLQTGVQLRDAKATYDYRHRATDADFGPFGDPVLRVDSTTVGLSPSGTDGAGWLAARTRAGALTTEVGVRMDRYGHTGEQAVSPRAHGSVALGTRTHLRASVGRYVQPHDLHELEVGDADTTFYGVEHALLAAVGLERELGSGIRARVEGYQRWTRDPRPYYLNVQRQLEAFPQVEEDRFRVEPAREIARGMEISLERTASSGLEWSATYVRSTARELVGDTWVPRAFDQPHALSLGARYRRGARWLMSASWHLHTGWPFTPTDLVLDTVTVFRDDGTASPIVIRSSFEDLNSVRLPTYHRLDIRVTRRFELRGGALDVYLDLFNAYDQPNYRAYRYRARVVGRSLVRQQIPTEQMLPILPSVGFRWEIGR